MIDLDRLLHFVRESLQVVAPIANDTPLFSSGLLDSVAMLQLIAFIEESAHIEIKAQDVTLENFDTANAILTYVAAESRNV